MTPQASTEKIGLVLLSGLAIGSTVVMYRLGLTEIPPLSLAALRLLVATLLFLLLLLMVQSKLPRDPRTLQDIVVVGITGTAFPLVFGALALQYISSGIGAIILATTPLFTALLAHLWLEERLNLIKAAGLVVAFAGVILLVTTRTTGLVVSTPGPDLRGQVLALGAVLLLAFSVVYTRRRLRGVDALVLTAATTFVAWLAVLPFALAMSSLDIGAITWRGWLVVSYTGAIGTPLIFFLSFYMIKRFGASAAVLPTFVAPAVAAFLGALVLGEIINMPLVAGAGLILVGVFLSIR